MPTLVTVKRSCHDDRLMPESLVEYHFRCLNGGMVKQEQSTADNNWQQVDRPGEGQAVCFDLHATMRLADGQAIDIKEQGFLLCFQRELRAWRNHCPHAGSPLDWIPGQFFSDDGEALICHTHGARFHPLSGVCLSGPCPRGLFSLQFLDQGDVVLVPMSVEITTTL